MQELTGARILMSEADAALLASGGTNDFTPYSKEMMDYRPAKADRILRDGDKVTLGGTTLTCHLTPGHTKGCTTWTMDVTEDGKVQHVVFFGSTSILQGVPLVNNPQYPGIAGDLVAGYKKLKSPPCDVFLAPHTGFFNLPAKAEGWRAARSPIRLLIQWRSRPSSNKRSENFSLSWIANERARQKRMCWETERLAS